ncbi:MAG: hypothetical protein GX282_07915 [Campylobacteraceae bacterium]|nr:hypothetical protein [Campylobacteraceae bacterium]
MQKSSFYIEIEKNRENKDLNKIITKSAYDEILKTGEEKNKVFVSLCGDLEALNLLNKTNLKSVIIGFKKATTKEKEETFLNLLYQAEKLRKEIIIVGRELRDESFESLKALEETVSTQSLNEKESVLSAINEALVDTTISADIIKEVSQNVFVSIIESAEDVEEVAYEFSKNLAYKSIIEEDFKQARVLDISKTILSEALNVADASQIYTKELIYGVVNGVNDGIVKSVEKFKDEFKFAPDEIASQFALIENELKNLDEEFVLILKNLAQTCEGSAKTILNELLKKEYDSYTAKMKKLTSETISQLGEKISDMELSSKFDEIKKEIVSKGAKFIDDFELNQKFENIKKELEETKIFSKFRNKDAKEISNRAFTASKDRVSDSKEECSDSNKE